MGEREREISQLKKQRLVLILLEPASVTVFNETLCDSNKIFSLTIIKRRRQFASRTSNLFSAFRCQFNQLQHNSEKDRKHIEGQGGNSVGYW